MVQIGFWSQTNEGHWRVPISVHQESVLFLCVTDPSSQGKSHSICIEDNWSVWLLRVRHALLLWDTWDYSDLLSLSFQFFITFAIIINCILLLFLLYVTTDLMWPPNGVHHIQSLLNVRRQFRSDFRSQKYYWYGNLAAKPRLCKLRNVKMDKLAQSLLWSSSVSHGSIFWG